MDSDLEGKNVFIQTVTNFFTGLVVSETKKTIVLEEAAWIADTGRLTEALAKEEFSEVEIYPKFLTVFKSAIVSYTEINTLPTRQK